MKQGIFIAVVGSVNADYSVFMKKLPLPGETVVASESGRFAGGKGLNQAVAIHRAGGDVTFQFAVGDDDDGKFLTNFLEDKTWSSREFSIPALQPVKPSYSWIKTARIRSQLFQELITVPN
ncbi:MAG: hypothetical protein ABR68_00365 [Microbacteriaceae bacterium BACL28 MAG-120531-bin53]|nr:MAG: hypothetical protein ABR68_00365 [Microbacteriaceae bacterium BACL28 MAG-120531-bin53]